MIQIILIIIGIAIIAYIGFKILKSIIKAIIIALLLFIVVIGSIAAVGYYDYKKIQASPFYIEIIEDDESISEFRVKGLNLSDLEQEEIDNGTVLSIDIDLIISHIPDKIEGIDGKSLIIDEIRKGNKEITAAAVVFTIKNMTSKEINDATEENKLIITPKPLTYKVLKYFL
jgi:energy-coupling factor transporter transmembrane protein EcfT